MVTLMVGNIAGLLAVMIANDYGIDSIVAYDNKDLYRELGFKVYDSIKDVEHISLILLSVHGREIVPAKILKEYKYCVNVHPFYNKYKGIRPVKRALENKEEVGEVTSHYMIEKVDEGKIIFQGHKTISGSTEQEIYQELYPLYAGVIKKTLDFLNTDIKMSFNLAY